MEQSKNGTVYLAINGKDLRANSVTDQLSLPPTSSSLCLFLDIGLLTFKSKL